MQEPERDPKQAGKVWDADGLPSVSVDAVSGRCLRNGSPVTRLPVKRKTDNYFSLHIVLFPLRLFFQTMNVC